MNVMCTLEQCPFLGGVSGEPTRFCKARNVFILPNGTCSVATKGAQQPIYRQDTPIGGYDPNLDNEAYNKE